MILYLKEHFHLLILFPNYFLCPAFSISQKKFAYQLHKKIIFFHAVSTVRELNQSEIILHLQFIYPSLFLFPDSGFLCCTVVIECLG